MRRAGIAVQQIVRLGAGCVQPTGERVDLTQLARQTVQERQQELLRRRAEIRVDIRPAEVLLDAAVAVELDRRDRRMNDNFHWYLLRQLGACCKLRINRSSSAATESAVIEFPKTFNSSAGLASVELLPGGAAESQLRNAWVLAIVRDPALRESVLKLMLRNGLEASVAENCEQARQLCASRKPKVLVFCHESMGVTQLRDELVHNRRSCALVQIIRGTPSFHAHGFSAFEFVKVGRSELAKELIPALLFELAQQG